VREREGVNPIFSWINEDSIAKHQRRWNCAPSGLKRCKYVVDQEVKERGWKGERSEGRGNNTLRKVATVYTVMQ
jgi:hypothetical protein